MRNVIKNIFKGTIIPVELSKITQHELYDDYCELMATANYMLPSAGILTEQAMDIFLVMHPIVVIRAKRSKELRYKCIGGIRSLHLAKSTLPLNKTVQVTCVERPEHDKLIRPVNADILLSPLLMSLRSPATIGAIYQNMNRQMKYEKLFNKGMHNKSKLADHMGYAKNTIFPPGKSPSGK